MMFMMLLLHLPNEKVECSPQVHRRVANVAEGPDALEATMGSCTC